MKFFYILLLLIPLSICQECAPPDQRIDCYPDGGVDESSCIARGCHFCQADEPGVPWCYLPEGYGYLMEGDPVDTGNGWRVNLRRATSVSYFGGDSEQLTLEAFFQSDYRLRIKITDGSDRFEVPLEILPPSGGNSNLLYDVEFSNDPVFSFRVIRKETGTVLFDTSLGGFTFSDQFLQLSSALPSKNFYGLGEQEHHSYRHNFDGFPLYPIYSRDHAPEGNSNIYGSQPYYLVLEEDGNTHSVAFVNSNAQEFVLLPNPGLLYRTIGGIFDLYFFLGPTPDEVTKQYTEAVGRSSIPPYWALGFHLCRWGYNALSTMRETVERNVNAGIALDVQYGDIDIMDEEMDFTYSPVRFNGFPQFIRDIKAQGIKFVTILDPFIAINQVNYRPFDLGEEMSVWVRRPDGTPVVGRVWPGAGTWPVYYPDYSRPATLEWWNILLDEFHDLLEYDGIWIDMNEVSNFEQGDWYDGCRFNSMNDPPYIPHIVDRSLSAKTICPDHFMTAGLQYNTHSLYGYFMSQSTDDGVKKALGKRPFVLTRSTFLGSGRYASHWLGDNWSLWTNLHYSIIGMLEFNQFGIPFVGSDICGFLLEAEKEMCQRWLELGAFYAFSRNHNIIGTQPQDPAVWGEDVINSTKKAYEVRYTLLPYLYTLFHRHNTEGTAVIRSLWSDYPRDANTFSIDRQFQWGSGLLVSPVLDPGTFEVNAYFPDARHYSYYDGAEVSARSAFATLEAPLDFIPVHVRGGHILPTQDPAVNTMLSRELPMGFIVALDDNDEASGDLYYDDGDSIDPVESGAYFLGSYQVSNRVFSSTIVQNGYAEMANKVIGKVRLFGASEVNQVTVNGEDHPFITAPSGEIVIEELSLLANVPFTITF